MKNISFKTIAVISITALFACSQNSKPAKAQSSQTDTPLTKPFKVPTHRYGGWYCPDNLNGFPAVDILDWKNVPVVNGRMATEEETRNGTSLIFVDTEKYPNAKPLDLMMPLLATYESQNSKRKELIIVIQALNIDNDSIVGFRYLNGGNGSARLNEIDVLTEQEIGAFSASHFFTESIVINATPNEIRQALTKPENADEFQSIIQTTVPFKPDWRVKTNVNYHYPNSGKITSAYADELFGNFYIQNDYEDFTEKFLVVFDQEKQETELKIVCGPFGEDYEIQKEVLTKWAKKVKTISEKV